MKPPPAIAGAEEPPMFLQRPSTGKSQDVRHILAKTFRQLYTRDTISPETVKNLSVSKGGDDEYHERYVEMLQKVTYHIITKLTKCIRSVLIYTVSFVVTVHIYWTDKIQIAIHVLRRKAFLICEILYINQKVD